MQIPHGSSIETCQCIQRIVTLLRCIDLPTTIDVFSRIGVLEGLTRNRDVSAGNAPPGSGLPVAKLNSA